MKIDINDVKIETANQNLKSSEFQKMVAMWVRDYRIAGDGCTDLADVYNAILNESPKTTLIATHEGVMIGFVTVSNKNHYNVITFSYTANRYRGVGVATKMYLEAIENLNADAIEVSFWRAKSKVEYWKSLGFKSFKKRPDQAYSKKSVCYLSQKDRCHSIMAFPLERHEISNFLRSQGRSVIDSLSSHVSQEQLNDFTNIAFTEFQNVNAAPKAKFLASS